MIDPIAEDLLARIETLKARVERLEGDLPAGWFESNHYSRYMGDGVYLTVFQNHGPEGPLWGGSYTSDYRFDGKLFRTRQEAMAHAEQCYNKARNR